MQAASIAELKKALVQLDHSELLDACLRLARFKKDNKELLTYLLFLSADEPEYAGYLCNEIDAFFEETPRMQRKTVRKVIRWMDKWLRFSGNKETEAQVRIHFCHALHNSKTPYEETTAMHNMYLGQIKKVHKAIEKMHADLRFDFRQQMQGL